eukprot:scaffold5383_cov222-Amphora_coffeaeformis.AAC.31
MRLSSNCKPRLSLWFCLQSLFVAALVQWGLFLRWHHQASDGMLSSVLDSSVYRFGHSKNLVVVTSENTFRRRINLPRHSSTPIPWVIFYHIYIPAHSTDRSSKALSIVREQLDQIRTSYAVQRQPANSTVLLYTTIGQRILPEVMKSMCQPELRCVNAQALRSGFEDKTLRKVHAYCTERPNVTVTYLHNKGSHHSRQGENDLWRQHMTLAVTSRDCYDTVALSNNKNASSCDACGLLFQSIPSLHFPGNFWTARCDYIRRLSSIAVFKEKLDSTLDVMDEYTTEGRMLTRELYTNTEDWATGRSRYGDEQWVSSHPDFKPCDVSSTPDLRYWKASPRSVSDFDWHAVPRRSLLDRHWQIQPRPNQETLQNRTKRLTDYHLIPGLLVRWWGLYNSFPSSASWVWRHLPDGDYWRSRMEQTLAVANRTNGDKDFNVVEYLLTRENFAPETNPTDPTLSLHESAPWTVFYHAYIPSGRNVSHIIEEQLSTLDQSHAAKTVLNPLTVYYSLVGDGSSLSGSEQEDEVARICHKYQNLYCERREQAVQGSENLTLASLRDFCVENPQQSVVYFHSKGSFHDSEENEHWRRHLLAAITSSDCLDSVSFSDTNTTAKCDVCGLQFYPIWSFFFPGNFFVGGCSYIRQLLPPNDFATGLTDAVNDMFALKKQNLFRTDLYSPKKEGNLGLDRYAWEFWVGSNPSIRPCDLSRTANFRHWVHPTQSTALDLKWSMAPRHDIWAPWYRIQQGKRVTVLADPSRRMREYFLLAGTLFKSLRLYNATPAEDSWIYKWFPDGPIWRQGVRQYGPSVVNVLLQNYRDGVNLTEPTF